MKLNTVSQAADPCSEYRRDDPNSPGLAALKVKVGLTGGWVEFFTVRLDDIDLEKALRGDLGGTGGMVLEGEAHEGGEEVMVVVTTTPDCSSVDNKWEIPESKLRLLLVKALAEITGS